MNLGVHVVATNDVGDDSCMIDVRTVDDDDDNNNNNNADDDSGKTRCYAFYFAPPPTWRAWREKYT